MKQKRLKHTKVYKQARSWFLMTLVLILITGINVTTLIRSIGTQPESWWDFLGGFSIVLAIVSLSSLWRSAVRELVNISEKERNLKWREQRLRWENRFSVKHPFTEEEAEQIAKDFMELPADVINPYR